MKWLLALCLGVSLSARQADIIEVGKRLDVNKFTYTEYPTKSTTWAVGDAKGKVVVLAFLAEGIKAGAQSLGELKALQKQEKAFDLLVVPIYDVESRKRIDTTTGSTGAENRTLQGIGVSAERAQDILAGDGMFRNMPIDFKIFQEFVPNHHVTLFPKFEGQPAIFILDRSGRIASMMWGYKKGDIMKTAEKILDEK